MSLKAISEYPLFLYIYLFIYLVYHLNIRRKKKKKQSALWMYKYKYTLYNSFSKPLKSKKINELFVGRYCRYIYHQKEQKPQGKNKKKNGES